MPLVRRQALSLSMVVVVVNSINSVIVLLVMPFTRFLRFKEESGFVVLLDCLTTRSIFRMQDFDVVLQCVLV